MILSKTTKHKLCVRKIVVHEKASEPRIKASLICARVVFCFLFRRCRRRRFARNSSTEPWKLGQAESFVGGTDSPPCAGQGSLGGLFFGSWFGSYNRTSLGGQWLSKFVKYLCCNFKSCYCNFEDHLEHSRFLLKS